MLVGLVWAMPVVAEEICSEGSETYAVRMVTGLGDIDLSLCPDDTPVTVANFLSYVRSGAYTQTGFIHRSIQEGIFIIQGGGFFIDTSAGGIDFMNEVQTQDSIAMEKVLSNLRGTISMARRASPDSATSQWFINVQHNPAFDDPLNEYAVFGGLTPESMEVVDAIAAIPTTTINPGLLTDTPLDGYPGGNTSYIPYLVMVTDVIDLPEPGSSLQALAALAGLALCARVRQRGSIRKSSRG